MSEHVGNVKMALADADNVTSMKSIENAVAIEDIPEAHPMQKSRIYGFGAGLGSAGSEPQL